MPRRPRPSTRPSPNKSETTRTRKLSNSSAPRIPKAVPKVIQVAETEFESRDEYEAEDEDEDVQETSDEEDKSSDQLDFEEGSSRGSGLEEDYNQDDDADAPRVAQWEDDDDDFLHEQSIEKKPVQDVPSEVSLKNNLQDLPLGALRQAQLILSQAEPESDSDSDADSHSASNDSEPEKHDAKGKGKEKIEKVEWNAKRRTDITKRSSKHAPTEVTSKRPVTRRRTVVEVPKIVPRDPRFLPTAGEFSADRFSKSYGFLADNRKKELHTLRDTLKQARKALVSSPRELRSEREHEVYRLEQAIKRTESLVNKDRLDQVQREALGKAKKEELAKRSEGKKAWYLKKGDKQKLIVEAKYEALAKEGGQRAVKKMMEKRQKKQSQKEKRSRPYAKGEEGMSRKRNSEGVDSGWPGAKRRRVV